MRRLKLLLAAFALFGVSATWAQTPVTSTYITNPGFEGGSKQFLKINDDGRGVQKPEGWSVEWTQASSSDHNGMTFVGSMTQDENTWSAYEGEKAYFTRMRWFNSTLNLRQTMINLRPGSYTLSFYATASKLADGGNGSASVSVAGQSQSITVGTSATTNWAEYTINFTVTTNPYATIEVTASRTGGNFKFGIDNFTLTYDGSSYYTTILSDAQSLYDDNVDWAEGADDLSAAITAATGKETIADKNAAIIALEEAMATFKETNTVDMTSRITNATFDSNISSWTVTGGDGNAYQWNNSSQNNFTGGFLEKWRNGWNGGYNQKNFDVSQTLSSLPNGEYTIKAAIIAVMQGGCESKTSGTWTYQNMKHGGPYYIDNEKGVWLYGTSGETTNAAWANTKNNEFDGNGAEYKTTTVKVENGSLTIGFKGIGSADGGTSLGTYANWIACDNWSLSYFGFDPSALKSRISGLKSDVQDIINGDAVPEAVKTNLQETLNDLVETPETKTVLDAAVNTLENAVASANETKSPYAAALALIDFVTSEVTNSTGTKTTINDAISTATTDIETRTAADDLISDYNTLETARQTYVTSGAQPTSGNSFDYTFKFLNPSFESTTDGWVVDRNTTGTWNYDIRQNTPVDGNDNLNVWAAQINWINVYQNITLPRGVYELSAYLYSSDPLSQHVYANNGTDYPSTNLTAKDNWEKLTSKFVNFSDVSTKIGIYSRGKNVSGNQEGWFRADNFQLLYKGNTLSESIEISSVGLATYASDYALDFTDVEGLTAYKASVSGTTATFTKVDKVPAGQGVLLEGVGKTYTVPMTNSADAIADNDFIRGTGAAVATDAGGGLSNFVLSTDDEGNNVGFYWANGVTVPTNRAYLQSTVAASRLTLVFEDEATGITDVRGKTPEVRSELYDLSGRRVAQPAKGLYIQNGKKVFIK